MVPMALYTHYGTAQSPQLLLWMCRIEWLGSSSMTPLLPWILLLWVGSNRANNLKPLVPNPTFFLPIPLFHPFSYGATFCWLGCTTPPLSAQFPFPHPNLMPWFMSWFCSWRGNVLTAVLLTLVQSASALLARANTLSSAVVACPGCTKSAKD